MPFMQIRLAYTQIWRRRKNKFKEQVLKSYCKEIKESSKIPLKEIFQVRTEITAETDRKLLDIKNYINKALKAFEVVIETITQNFESKRSNDLNEIMKGQNSLKEQNQQQSELIKNYQKATKDEHILIYNEIVKNAEKIKRQEERMNFNENEINQLNGTSIIIFLFKWI